MRLFRALVLLVPTFLAAASAYVLLNFFEVLYVGQVLTTSPVDAIVVMGAAQYDGTPSPQLAARLDHALDLYRAGVAPLIAVTGGKRPGDRFTEAAASRKYLVVRGVPDSAIIDEDQGRSTWESVHRLTVVLKQQNVQLVIAVSDGYHIQRTLLSFREAGIDANGSATHTSPVRGHLAVARSIRESLGVSVGRLIGFQLLWRITG